MQENETNTAHFNFYRLFFLVILGVSIFLRWPFIFVERLWPDEALYAWNAKQIFHHPGLMFSKEICDFHPPLFSALLSLWHFILPPKLACHAMAFVTGILGIIAVYWLGRKIRGIFLGCFAAMMLGFNLLYFTLSNYILIDTVLTAVMILFLYLLSADTSRVITRKDFYLGLAVMAMILLKWSGGLVLPLIVVYYALAFPEWTFRERLRKASVPLMFGIATAALLFIHNYAVTGNWIPKVFTDSNEAFRAPYYYYVQLLAYLIEQPMIPFFIVGLWYVLRSGYRHYWVHVVWIVGAIAVTSAMSNKDMRFLLPLMPSIVLITGISADAFFNKVEKFTSMDMFKPLFLVLMFAFLLNTTYAKAQSDTRLNSFTFIGYEQAGEYIRQEAARSPDTVILAGSPRIIRYYTDINLKEYAGSISPIPSSEEGLKDLLAKTSSAVLLQVDAWEKLQPKWVFPMDDNKIRLLDAHGFKLEKIIRKNISESEAGKDRTVVWVFRRPGNR